MAGAHIEPPRHADGVRAPSALLMATSITQPLLPLFVPAARLDREGQNARIILRGEHGELVGATAMVRLHRNALANDDARLACLQGFGRDNDAMLLAGIDGATYLVSGPRLTIGGARPVPGSTLYATSVTGVACGDLQVRTVYRGDPSAPALGHARFAARDIDGIIKINAPHVVPPPARPILGLSMLAGVGAALALTAPGILVPLLAAAGAVASLTAIVSIIKARSDHAASLRAAKDAARREDDADRALYGTGIREEPTSQWISSTPTGSGSPASPSSSLPSSD